MSIDARGHDVPGGGDDPGQVIAQLAALSLSIRDVVFVANVTERNGVASALVASATNPVYVHRADAALGRELEVTTDGATWYAIPSSHAGAGARASGTAIITPTTAGVPASATIAFPAGLFTTTPIVVVSANSASVGTQITGVGATGVSTSGGTLWACRTNNTDPVGVSWVAVA